MMTIRAAIEVPNGRPSPPNFLGPRDVTPFRRAVRYIQTCRRLSLPCEVEVRRYLFKSLPIFAHPAWLETKLAWKLAIIVRMPSPPPAHLVKPDPPPQEAPPPDLEFPKFKRTPPFPLGEWEWQWGAGRTGYKLRHPSGTIHLVQPRPDPLSDRTSSDGGADESVEEILMRSGWAIWAGKPGQEWQVYNRLLRPLDAWKGADMIAQRAAQFGISLDSRDAIPKDAGPKFAGILEWLNGKRAV